MSIGRVQTIAVVSQAWAGHIPTYHRLYAETFRASGCRVLEIVPRPPTWISRLLRQPDRFRWILGWRTWLAAARAIRDAERCAGVRADAAFLTYLDLGFMQPAVDPEWLDRWFSWRWAGVSNSPLVVRGPVPAFPAGERVLAARRCRVVVVTDDEFVPRCTPVWPGRRVVAMPEVADLSAPDAPPAIEELRRFAGGRKCVGLVGVISAKKNIEPFLALARATEAARKEVVFFLAGDFTAQACPGPERRRLQAALAQAPANCRLFPEPIPDGPAFNAWVAASDVVWAAYRNVIYKSNVLTKAAWFHKPVLVSPGAIMAAQTARYRLGEIVDVNDTPAALTALQRLLAPAAVDRDYAGFTALNSPARMGDTVTSILQALAGS